MPRRHRSHSTEFKRQVVAEFQGGETLHALDRRHDLSRNLVRVWIEKAEAGALDEDVAAAELMAEDTARRLALARPRVRFLSGHDSMLSEWLDPPAPGGSCLLIIDVIPYAAECETLARMAREQGRSVVVITDEYCHWAHEVTDAVINTPSKTGLFLESILGLNAATSLLVHATATASGADMDQRMRDWKRLAHRIGIF
ncbi:hypothetical protein AYJ57_20275 [Salipiger sp. CCB-MM3]|uniref:transposase n=1 Tax=Salipiger sp. CCB-MM3 TaxID=1792508 RepID=UPI00080ABBCA|nr:transposase [Salipiger sp. CCB-MM3]ANT62713.1 hypothetical protein AYJ57_20275 [Salipiger sp. CCB-MM3]